MKNVIEFPTKVRATEPKRSACDGATLFMHMRNKTLIVHLVNPRGDRTIAVGSSSKR